VRCCQVKSLKEKITLLFNKTENDDRLIGAMRIEMGELKRSAAKSVGSAIPPPSSLNLGFLR
jgi:hypothetical protein